MGLKPTEMYIRFVLDTALVWAEENKERLLNLFDCYVSEDSESVVLDSIEHRDRILDLRLDGKPIPPAPEVKEPEVVESAHREESVAVKADSLIRHAELLKVAGHGPYEVALRLKDVVESPRYTKQLEDILPHLVDQQEREGLKSKSRMRLLLEKAPHTLHKEQVYLACLFAMGSSWSPYVRRAAWPDHWLTTEEISWFIDNQIRSYGFFFSSVLETRLQTIMNDVRGPFRKDGKGLRVLAPYSLRNVIDQRAKSFEEDALECHKHPIFGNYWTTPSRAVRVERVFRSVETLYRPYSAQPAEIKTSIKDMPPVVRSEETYPHIARLLDSFWKKGFSLPVVARTILSAHKAGALRHFEKPNWKSQSVLAHFYMVIYDTLAEHSPPGSYTPISELGGK